MPNPSAIRILYIEDDVALCEQFKVVVKTRGYGVDTALKGEEGLALHGAQPYDLIVVDYQLPDMTGIDIARNLLIDDPKTPIVMVTGRGSEQVAAEALALGVSNYVIKDSGKVYLELLTNIIRSALKSSAERYEKIIAETALKRSEERFRDFANASSDWFWEMDENLCFTYFSNRFTEISGVPAEDMIGKMKQETGLDMEDERVLRNIEDLEAHCPFKNFEHSRTRPDGRVVHLSTSGTPVFDEDGAFLGYRGTGTDITERKQIEHELREARDNLEARVEERAKKQ